MIANSTIDRSKTCPFLIHCHFKSGSFTEINQFANNSESLNPIDLHLWKDTTLRELISLLALKNQDFAGKPVKSRIRLVFPDSGRPGRFLFREIGKVMNFRKNDDDDLIFGDSRFNIGDLIDIRLDDTSDPNYTEFTGPIRRASAAREARFNPMASTRGRGAFINRMENNHSGRDQGRPDDHYSSKGQSESVRVENRSHTAGDRRMSDRQDTRHRMNEHQDSRHSHQGSDRFSSNNRGGNTRSFGGGHDQRSADNNNSYRR